MIHLTLISTPFKLMRQAFWAVCLVSLMSLLLPAVALADSPETCSQCHSDEMTAWQNSPHAKIASEAVTCESCHGPYAEDHPEEGIMQLGVDSAICQDCHGDTFTQWQNSSHGQANVQCISCHMSHSQEFRLTDEKLCQSCHRDQLNDFSHATHNEANLACTDCHEGGISPAGAEAGGAAPRDHSFGVTTKACVACHERTQAESSFQVDSRPDGSGNQVSELSAKLKATEQSNLSLKGLSVGSLGLGMGIGGMLGIIFVVVISRVNQRSVKI